MVVAEHLAPPTGQPETGSVTTVVGRGRTVAIGHDTSTTIIGERCNALGYRSVMRAVRAGKFSVLAERARAQETAGATLVNCNVVGQDIDEPKALVAAVKAMSAAVDIP